VQGGGGVGTSGVGFSRPQRMARATRWQSTGGLGENAAMAAMWASVARSGFGASGLGWIRGLGPPRKNDLYFSKTNFYSTQKSVENLTKYLGTSEKYENFSRDRVEYVAQLLY
jgi:hypothetical protein